MVRKLSLAIALALGVSPFAAYSLGLGSIKTKSGLNQQFQADIELLSLGTEEIADIKVSLAAQEVFTKAGVNRPYFLSQLNFKPLRLADGKGVIRVTSRDPVREPFLNFLIELNWPNGRLYREYTVLLDPPVTLQRRPVAVQAPTTSEKSGITRKAAPADPARTAVSGEYGPTRRNDTLWKIAAEVRHPGASMQQMMMAIFEANPNAFIQRNINRLKVGEVLRVPESDKVLAMTAGEARTAFRDQMESKRAEPAPEAVQPATESAMADTGQAEEAVETEAAVGMAGDQKPAEAELKIASTQTMDEAGKSVADSQDQGESSTALRDDLIVAREMRESALEESRELKGRVENLSSQLEDLQRLLELKDEQLAKLQMALGEQPDAPAMELTETDTLPEAEPMQESVEPGGEKETAAGEMPAPELESIGDEQIEIEVSESDRAMGESLTASGADEAPATAADMVEKAEITPSVETESAPKPEPPVAAPQPTAEIKPSSEAMPAKKPAPGIIEKITNNPVMLAIGGGALAVIFGLIWLLSGRRRKESEEFQESILMDTIGEKDEPREAVQVEAPEPESTTTEETSFLSDFSPSDISELPADTGEVDAIAEADVYIAYGRYGQAEELVRQGLAKNPGNSELKLKLFEILHATKNLNGFIELAESVNAEGLPDSEPNVWAAIVEMGAKLAPDHRLFAAKPGAASTPQEEIQADLDDLDNLDFGDLTASLDLDQELKDEAAQTDQSVQGSETAAEPSGAVDMDNLGDDLAALDSALEDDQQAGDALDLSKIAETSVSPGDEESLSLDQVSLDLEADMGTAGESGLSAEGEKLELPEEEADSGPITDVIYTSDEIDTKLDLARAYLDVGDEEGARSMLQEVVNEGDEKQKQAAQEMLNSIS